MMAEALAEQATLKTVGGGPLEVFEGGVGRTILLLHGSYGWWGWEPVHDRLAARYRIVAPLSPGFGRSPRRDGLDTVDDLAYFFLDALEELAGPNPWIVGFGLGGWIATEMAVRCPDAIERLVLVDSVGIKVSDRETRDIGDPFIRVGDSHHAMLFHDPQTHRVPLPAAGMPEPLLEAMLRNQESAVLYGWKPYMHNPKLRQRLHRVKARTLLVWGEDDRIVSTSYGQAFASLISGARLITIPDAGHYPHREQTDRFVAVVSEFLR